MSFSWLFAIIAGAAILFLAIYATSRFIETGRTEIDAQIATKLAILLDPLETSLESGRSSSLSFSSRTRIYNDKCKVSGNFGNQQIGIASSSSLGKKWQAAVYGKKQYNKYIFSQNTEEGKELSVFTLLFKMPFKISDLIILVGGEYCFVQAPEEIEDELEDLNIKGVNFTQTKSDCSKNSKKVCFSSSGCDISVYGDDYEFKSGYVSKESKKLYYVRGVDDVDSLIYAALFSSPEVYECNVKRLMSRLVNLCAIHKDKIEILEKKECSSTLDTHLTELSTLAGNLKSSQGLADVKDEADEIDNINEAATCKLYES